MAHSLHSLYSAPATRTCPPSRRPSPPSRSAVRGGASPLAAYFPEGLIYTDVVRHAAKVERYFEVFGRENVDCILFDDLVNDTAARLPAKALEFLGVDPEFQAELDHRKAGQRARMRGSGSCAGRRRR